MTSKLGTPSLSAVYRALVSLRKRVAEIEETLDGTRQFLSARLDEVDLPK